jgi:hypothetical protein
MRVSFMTQETDWLTWEGLKDEEIDLCTEFGCVCPLQFVYLLKDSAQPNKE